MKTLREYIDIVSEVKGDSQLDLDKIAAKYTPGYSWADTHYKNILYRVEPPTEMIKLALRLDGDEPGEYTEQLLQDHLEDNGADPTWDFISGPEVFGFDTDKEAPVPPMTLDYYTAMVESLIPLSLVVENPADGETYYIIDVDGNSALIFRTVTDDQYFVTRAIGNSNAVVKWLKNYRAKYERSHPIK